MVSAGPMYDVCVVGLGAVGVIYASILEKSGRARVTAVCRSNFNIVSDTGVDVVSEKLGNVPAWKPYRVVSSVAQAADRQYRFVVCCFKALPDIVTTPTLIQPLLDKTKTFVLIQNGVGIETDLYKVVPRATIISCSAWLDSTTTNEGRTVRHGAMERLTMGVYKSPSYWPFFYGVYEKAGMESLHLFADLLRSGGGNPDCCRDIEAMRWRKVAWNASFSSLCTIAHTGMKGVVRCESTRVAIHDLMTEVTEVARAAGIHCGDESSAEVMNWINSFRAPHAKDFKPSMLVDLENNRPIEVEPIVGAVIRKAREVGAETPQLDRAYNSLKMIQRELLAQRPEK